jgi:organic radical activating enzyme
VRQKSLPSSTPLVKMLDARSARRSFAFLYITNLCNLTCAHCSFQSAPDKKQSHMDTGLVLRLLDELYGIHDITITGGEPLLHPDFSQILSHAARSAAIVYMMTNGIALIGEEHLSKLAKAKNLPGLKHKLKKVLNGFPENLHLFFPLDTFHLQALRRYGFLLQGLAELAAEWNTIADKPSIGFLCNEVSQPVSEKLCKEFNAELYCHIGTAIFSPWRKVKSIYPWYLAHPLNQMPFPGGMYINYKGVYLNEAALLLDLREGIETPLKLGIPQQENQNKQQLLDLYRKALQR